MMGHSSAISQPRSIRHVVQLKNGTVALAYLALLLIPFLATLSLNIDDKGLYSTVLGFLNAVAMMAFFVQFPLAGRLKHLPMFSNIVWSMSKHKAVGRWLGVYFFFCIPP